MIKSPQTVSMMLAALAASVLGNPSRTVARIAMADAQIVHGSFGPARSNKRSRWKRMRRTAAYHNNH